MIFGTQAVTKTYVEGGLFYYTSTVIVPIIAIFVISNIDFSENDILNWTRAIVISAVSVAGFGVIVSLMNPTERIGSTWSNAMTINGFYTVGFFFAIANALKSKISVSKIGWSIAAVIIFLGMVYTYTRIALVAVIFGLFILMLKMKKMRIYGIVAFGLIPLIIPSSLTQRIATGISMDWSIIIRLVVWYKSIGVILQHPLTGIGFSTWKDIYHGMVPFKLIYAQHAHNVALNIMLEIGIIGFLAYATPIVSTLKNYYRHVVKPGQDMFHFTVLVAILALLVDCLSDIFVQQYSVSILFWISIALMYNKARAVRQTDLIG